MQNNYLIQDHDAIELTARVLATSETRLFELAYQEWHGRAVQKRELERAFLAYLFDGRVPCWVRAFTRQTLQLCDEAGLALPVTQSSHYLTHMVSQTAIFWMLIGLGTLCLGWLAGLL